MYKLTTGEDNLIMWPGLVYKTQEGGHPHLPIQVPSAVASDWGHRAGRAAGSRTVGAHSLSTDCGISLHQIDT